MPMTPGNKLYLYRLLRDAMGAGRQTMLSRIEEILEADDLMPSDVGCANTRELLEQLDFIRLTVFKRGRIYATVIAQPELDELLERAAAKSDEDTKASTAAGKRRSWRRKKGAKDIRPAKPRPKGRVKPDVERAEAEAESQVIATKAGHEPRAAEKQRLENAASESADLLRPTSEAQATSTPAQQITPMPAAQQQPAPTSEVITMPQPTSAITYEPAPQVAPDSAQQTTFDAAPMPETHQRPIPHQAPTRPVPHSFFREVWCPSDVLGALYEVLPLDVNPLSLLDEDWTVARATNSFEQTARGVAYPLRCLSTSDGTPVRAHLHRQGPTASGKHWRLASLDGISQDAFVDLGGLPANTEGAWADLDGLPAGVYRPTSPLREFSRFALIGSWSEVLPELEALAEPEPWGPGLENLREYFLVTFHRAKSQGRIGVSANKQHAAFDTGLLTKDAQPIYACFDARDDSIAWQLESFSTTTRLEKDPEPATYVSSLSHLCLVAPHAVRLSRPVRKTYGEALDTPIARAMLRAQRSHRVSTPAYDPQTEELRLLLPLASRGGSTIDRAVVLADLGDGDYEARAVLSLDRARACARVVTSDLPAWLR